jgi:hypothetical protein
MINQPRPDKNKDNTHQQIVLLLHAFSVAVFILVCYFLPVSTELTKINNLIIGDATFSGVDIGLRVSAMYKFLFGGMALAAIFYSLFRYLQAKTGFRFLHHRELLLFSVPILCLSFLHVAGIENLDVIKILFGLFCIRLIILLPFRYVAFLACNIRDQMRFAISLPLAFLMLFSLIFLVGYQSVMKENVAGIYLLLVLLCFLIQRVLHYFKLPKRVHFLKALLPFTAMPLLAFCVLEVLFFIRQEYGYTINYKLIFIGCFLLISMLTWFFRKRQILARLTEEKIIGKMLAPSVLIAFVLLVYYFPMLQPQKEMFESGNAANSVLNVFRFGKIPLLDFSSAHMLSEQWSCYLYTLIFGWNGQQDFLIYNFLNSLLFYFILFWLLNKLFGRPLLSVFFILLFPFIRSVFFPHIFFAVLPLFLSRQLLERPTVGAFLRLMLLLLLLILWKIDPGAAAVFASLLYFPVLWFISGTKFPFKVFFKALGIFVLICLGGIGCSFLLRSPEQVLTGCKMMLHLFSGSQAHGYFQLMSKPPQQFYIYHVLFPFVAVLLCIYIGFTLKKNYRTSSWKENFWLLAALFLYLMFFGNLQRGLVRHGFAERGEDYLITMFFAATALLAVHRFRTRTAIYRMAIFYASLFFLFIGLKFFPYESDGYSMETALSNNTFQTDYNSLDWKLYHGRTLTDKAFERKNYGDLKLFLDKNIGAKQTFVDFSNTPILYFYCKRPVVGYFTQNMQNTIDDYMQFDMLKKAGVNEAPVVVYANYPRSFFDATDNVPNNLRYYLIAEHIFEHYRPYGVIGNKSIWVSGSLRNLPAPTVKDTLIDQVDSVNFRLMAEYNGMFYNNPSSGKEHAKELDAVFQKDKKNFVLSNDSLFITLDQHILALKHCYLSVEFEKRAEYFEPFNTQVRFADSAKNTVGIFSFARRDRISSIYMFRLSNHYFWHTNNTLEMCIPAGAEVKRVLVLKDRRFKN